MTGDAMDHGYEEQPTAGDLELARRLADGASLESLSSDSALDDDERRVARAVYALRSEYPASGVDAQTSARIWAKVSDATSTPALAGSRPDARPRVLHLVRQPVFRFAVAAAIVFLVVWSVLTPSRVEWAVVARATSDTVRFESPDGSVIRLRPYSTLSASGASGRVYRLDGEGFFEVAHDADSPFTVDAGASRVTVLGTRFNLATWSDAPQVYLEDGSVRFESTGSADFVILRPGQSATLGSTGPELVEDPVEEDALDWLSGALSFSSRTVGEVAAELGQHYDVTISVETAIARERLTGRIILGDLDDALDDLGTVLGGRFVRQTDGSFRFE